MLPRAFIIISIINFFFAPLYGSLAADYFSGITAMYFIMVSCLWPLGWAIIHMFRAGVL